jgi:hypothetical protein
MRKSEKIAELRHFKVTWVREYFGSDFATCSPGPKCINAGSKAYRDDNVFTINHLLLILSDSWCTVYLDFLHIKILWPVTCRSFVHNDKCAYCQQCTIVQKAKHDVSQYWTKMQSHCEPIVLCWWFRSLDVTHLFVRNSAYRTFKMHAIIIQYLFRIQRYNPQSIHTTTILNVSHTSPSAMSHNSHPR